MKLLILRRSLRTHPIWMTPSKKLFKWVRTMKLMIILHPIPDQTLDRWS
jgi:hypothetical protein